MRPSSLALALLGALLAAAPLAAQEEGGAPKPEPAKPAPKPAPPVPEPKLIFDREIFDFPVGGRRDPFTPLTGKNDAGPRFEDLSVKGIIYSPTGESVVVLSDGKKSYRRHRGEMVGNARVVQISPTRVIFSVDDFGVWRQESLDLKKNLEGDKG